MNKISLEGVYDGNNFIIDTLAKYIRDNNYPELDKQMFNIVASNYNRILVSKGDAYLLAGMQSELKMFPEDFLISSDVYYQTDVYYQYTDGSFYMLIDNNYYWATI